MKLDFMGNLCKSSRYPVNHCIRKLGVGIKFISILREKYKHFILRKSLFLPYWVECAGLICGIKLKNLENILNIFLRVLILEICDGLVENQNVNKEIIAYFVLFLIYGLQ